MWINICIIRDELDKDNRKNRRELMELQYQVGRLELENMELEQHCIVHEAVLKGKDLTIQKLKYEECPLLLQCVLLI